MAGPSQTVGQAISDYSVPPEEDGINFAPRGRTPTLIINGGYERTSPVGPYHPPMFCFLGTSVRDKGYAVLAAGHRLPTDLTIKEALDRPDRQLGPVQSSTTGSSVAETKTAHATPKSNRACRDHR